MFQVYLGFFFFGTMYLFTNVFILQIVLLTNIIQNNSLHTYEIKGTEKLNKARKL